MSPLLHRSRFHIYFYCLLTYSYRPARNIDSLGISQLLVISEVQKLGLSSSRVYSGHMQPGTRTHTRVRVHAHIRDIHNEEVTKYAALTILQFDCEREFCICLFVSVSIFVVCCRCVYFIFYFSFLFHFFFFFVSSKRKIEKRVKQVPLKM